MLPMPVMQDALQTDRKLKSFTMIFFIPVSTGTFLFRKDDLTADLSALRGLLSNCLLLCYRHDGRLTLLFLHCDFREDEISSSLVSNKTQDHREDTTMKKQNTNTLMTYDQWECRFKKALKKTIKQKLNTALQYFAFFVLMVGFPLGMIVHWLLFGY